MGDLVNTPKQYVFDLKVAKEKEIDGIGMGVLSDGTAYLNTRGLARMCGVDPSVIVRLAINWNLHETPPRETKIQEMLREQGFVVDKPYIAVQHNGVQTNAYPDIVCMAVLEYYAFQSKLANSEKARENYRLLARASFTQFIYKKIGFDPHQGQEVAWQQFHDRVTLNWGVVPDGYFSIFKEAAELIVMLIRAKANVGIHFVPDGSMGIHWGKHWTGNKLATQYGERRQYQHRYPDYFPQSKSNPQDAHCYPDEALAAFKRWTREVYCADKLIPYLSAKAKEGALPLEFVETARLTFQPAN
jgi:hypothetical protein